MIKDIDSMSNWDIERYLENRKHKEWEDKRKIERQLRETFKSTNTFEYFGSSDYVGFNIDNLSFYYGYEQTDDNDEWCFVATEDGVEEMRIPQSQLWYIKDAVIELYLMSGVAKYLQTKNLTRLKEQD